MPPNLEQITPIAGYSRKPIGGHAHKGYANIAIVGNDYAVVARSDGSVDFVLGADNSLIRSLPPNYVTVNLFMLPSTPVQDEDVNAILHWTNPFFTLNILGSDELVYKLSEQGTKLRPLRVINFTLTSNLFAIMKSLKSFVQSLEAMTIDASALSDAEISEYVADNEQYLTGCDYFAINGTQILFTAPHGCE